MRVRVDYTEELDERDVAAYCQYHHIARMPRAAVRSWIRATLEQVGTMGLEEQISEGRVSLAALAGGPDAEARDAE